ncbi:MAG: cyclase family protein [Bacteroidota bacterium]
MIPELIDLSQPIYQGMPVYKRLPQVRMEVAVTHEEWEGDTSGQTATPSVHRLEMSEHTGTHVDSISHMDKAYPEASIDTMPLEMFYTEAFCLDFSHKQLRELITLEEIKAAIVAIGEVVKAGDTILFYTDHYRRHFQTENWGKGPGLTADAARWLGEQKIAGFGVETMSPGVSGVSNREVHRICGELYFTHYENMINLHRLVGRGRFRFIAFPLNIRGGTGSPVRAVAVFEE